MKRGNGKFKRFMKKWGIIIIGILVLAYPSFSNWYNNIQNKHSIVQYENDVKQLSAEDMAELWLDAEEYNLNYPENRFGDFYTDSKEYVPEAPYDTYLDPANDGIMGYIDIPKIDVHLAIHHGIGADVLETGVGHVEGSSLPIGGPGTHAVLAGHRGLPRARLFTDLDEMKEGDLFSLQILNEKLWYKVDKISVVEPDKINEVKTVPGKDFVTLVTCTPYGVNSHRLLVRGERTAAPSPGAVPAFRFHLDKGQIAILIALAFVAIEALRTWHSRRKYKKRSTAQAENI
jgi:sortase A